MEFCRFWMDFRNFGCFPRFLLFLLYFCENSPWCLYISYKAFDLYLLVKKSKNLELKLIFNHQIMSKIAWLIVTPDLNPIIANFLSKSFRVYYFSFLVIFVGKLHFKHNLVFCHFKCFFMFLLFFKFISVIFAIFPIF